MRDARSPLAPLRLLAIEACKQHNEIDLAVRYALEKLDADPGLRKKLLKPMVERAVRVAVHDIRKKNLRSTKRGEDWKPVVQKVGQPRGLDIIEQAGRAAMGTFLDRWVMDDGTVLGDANAEELTHRACREESLERGHFLNGSFYRRLAVKLKLDKTVRQCVKPEDAIRLWNEIRGQDAALAKFAREETKTATKGRGLGATQVTNAPVTV